MQNNTYINIPATDANLQQVFEHLLRQADIQGDPQESFNEFYNRFTKLANEFFNKIIHEWQDTLSEEQIKALEEGD